MDRRAYAPVMTNVLKRLPWLLFVLQGALGLRVIARMIGTARRSQKLSEDGKGDAMIADMHVAVIVPVLNEYRRLAPCLEGLMAQGEEVREILVVDGGSEDGTQELVTSYAQCDRRIRLVDASPVPDNWNGKAWGLQVGVEAIEATGIQSRWILTVDADVRPRCGLVSALLAQARQLSLTALSIATTQELNSPGEGLLHPAMLATLVYRFGLPGGVFRHVHEVQANGQCFLVERATLATIDNFRETRSSICEDVTLARLLVNAGYRVGFFESENGNLVSVRMYENWRELWRNWSRSLPMRDRFTGWHALSEWLEIALVQALPLPLCMALLATRTARRGRWLLALNGVLLALRFGVLLGTERAYQRRPWTYWLSPLCDVPVALQLARQALRRRHTWRGRPIIRS